MEKASLRAAMEKRIQDMVDDSTVDRMNKKVSIVYERFDDETQIQVEYQQMKKKWHDIRQTITVLVQNAMALYVVAQKKKGCAGTSVIIPSSDMLSFLRTLSSDDCAKRETHTRSQDLNRESSTENERN